MTPQEAVLALMTVRKEVFGDRPDDELNRIMNDAIDALVSHIFSNMSDATAQSAGDTQ